MEKKLNHIKSCLCKAPEVSDYEVLDSGLEIWVRLSHSIAYSSELIDAMRTADTYQIDFNERLIRLYIVLGDLTESF